MTDRVCENCRDSGSNGWHRHHHLQDHHDHTKGPGDSDDFHAGVYRKPDFWSYEGEVAKLQG